ncbi:MAG: hypothetical protein WC856_21640 [Methylococcaceae bacterium]|jgi:hypothetical protein
MTGIKFPELEQLERIIEQLGDRAQTEVIDRIQYKDHAIASLWVQPGPMRLY